jgi:hypothetical protein
MTNTEYLIQALLYLTAIAAIPLSLTKRPISRLLRLVAALCPIALGIAYYIMANQTSGIFVALMGLWALFFVTISKPRPEKKEELE